MFCSFEVRTPQIVPYKVKTRSTLLEHENAFFSILESRSTIKDLKLDYSNAIGMHCQQTWDSMYYFFQRNLTMYLALETPN